MANARRHAEVVVIGAGPGGYVAAIRAADLGRKVVVIEARERLGGVCLLEGCIPSKALISTVELAEAARQAKRMGLSFDNLRLDHAKLRKFADSVVKALARGIDGLFKKRGVEVLRGRARFTSASTLSISGGEVDELEFDQCIVATGSRPALPPIPGVETEGIWTSTEALELREIPERLLVVGGGYIGLELGSVYAGLGSKVLCVEALPHLLGGADRDLVDVVARRLRKRFAQVMLGTKVVGIKEAPAFGGFAVQVEGADVERKTLEVDRVLIAVGRRPNTDDLGLDRTRVEVDRYGLITVDEQRRTAEPTIFAIGDVTAGPGLAHKASREGKVAAEVIAGRPSAFDNVSVPAIVFTDPELAWVGLTEAEAQAAGYGVRVGRFPLTALGRARTLGRTDGMAKVITDEGTGRVLGVGLVGVHASELIAEATLALEMGATVEDISATIHPHPTLSEAIAEAADVAEGVAVHIYPPDGL